MVNRELSELFTVSSEQVVGSNGERTYLEFGHRFKDRIKIVLAARAQNMELQSLRISGRLRDARSCLGISSHGRIDQKSHIYN